MTDKSFLNFIEDYVISVLQDGTIKWANKAFVNAHVQELSNISQIVYKLDQQSFHQFLQSNTTDDDFIDIRILSKSEYPTWIRWKKYVQGNKDEFFLIGRFNELFDLSSENFLKIASLASISYFEFTQIDYLIPLNFSIRQILGLSADLKTITLNEFVDFIFSEDVLKFQNWINELPEAVDISTVEYRLLNKKGEIKNIKSFAQIVTFNKNNAERYRVYLQDITQLNESLMLFRQSDEQFKSIFNSSPVPILYVAPNGKILDVNNSAISVLGSPSVEATKNINLLSFEPLIESGISQAVKNCIDSKMSVTFEAHYETKWGKDIWLKSQITPIIDDEFRVDALMIIFDDITREIKAKEQLELAEKRNRIILQAIPDTILVVDRHFQILDIHNTVQTYIEPDSELLLPKTLREYFPGDLFQLYARKLQLAHKTGNPITFEYQNVNHKIKSWYESRIVKVEQNLTLIIIRDITESKLSKQELIISEARLLSAQRMAHMGWYEALIKEKGFIASEEAFLIFFEEPINKPIPESMIFERIHPEDLDYFRNTVITNIQLKSKEFAWEFRLITPSGKIKHIASKAFLSYDEQGELIRRFGIVQDITQRKESEKALAQSEARLTEAQKTAKVGWYEVILDTNEYIGSPETYQIFFLKESKRPIPTPELIAIIHPDDRDEFIKSLTSHLKNRSRQFTLNYRILGPNDEIKHLVIIGNSEYDDEGNITRRYGTVQDVTQHKAYELALARSEARLKEAQAIARLGYFEYDLLTRKIFLSAEAKNIVGLGEEESGFSFDENMNQILPEDVEQVKNQILNISEPRTSTLVRIKTPKGEMKITQLVIDKSIEQGKIRSIKGTIQDITERIKAQEAIEESESRFRSIFEGSSVGIVIFNIEGKFLQCNNAFNCMINIYDPIVMEKYNLFDDRNIPVEYKTQIKQTKPVSFDSLANYTFLNPQVVDYKNKRIHYFEYRITTISHHENKNNAAYLMMVTDVSERKQLEIELIAAKEKAEESDALKSAFLANMSHEIRTPMNAIIGFASLLELDGYTEEEKTNFIKTIAVNGQHLLNLINDIIDVSKIEANQLTLQLSYIKINQILSDVESLMNNLVPSQVSFSLQYGLIDSEAIVYSDEQRVKQILINLINNAFKFTDEGEVVFGYRLHQNQNQLVFYVSDTGCGIPENKAQEIFHRFHQLDHIKQGAGLGLSISKGLITLLGGDIWVETKLGKGSTFYFTLPYQSPDRN